jgi:hypothetical protein
VTTVNTQGNVQGDPSTKPTFGPNGGDYSIFRGSYYNLTLDGYGIAVV